MWKKRFMIGARSSVSICSASSIEPFTSANSTVTCLRSPSNAAFDCRILSARCLGVYARGLRARSLVVRLLVAAGPPSPSALPQSAQNFAPGALSELQFEQRFDSGLPHSAQNFLPGLPSVPHFPQRILYSQLVEQRLRVFQICCVEAFGEPVVDFGEHAARLIATALRREQPREAHRRAQFP